MSEFDDLWTAAMTTQAGATEAVRVEESRALTKQAWHQLMPLIHQCFDPESPPISGQAKMDAYT